MLDYLRDPSSGSLTVMQVRQASADEPAVTRLWSRDPRDVGTARGALVDTLARWGLEQVSDSAVLVLSELLTNAMRHTQETSPCAIETRFLRVGCGLRIEVHDGGGDSWPVLRSAGPGALNGRGLALVAALADAWDVMPGERGGKVVWAELSTSPGEGGCR